MVGALCPVGTWVCNHPCACEYGTKHTSSVSPRACLILFCNKLRLLPDGILKESTDFQAWKELYTYVPTCTCEARARTCMYMYMEHWAIFFLSVFLQRGEHSKGSFEDTASQLLRDNCEPIHREWGRGLKYTLCRICMYMYNICMYTVLNVWSTCTCIC